MGLGLIIAFLQAFIFALLTMIYIGLALAEPH
jgi:F0F1-type ATP synthase membrane subunit a